MPSMSLLEGGKTTKHTVERMETHGYPTDLRQNVCNMVNPVGQRAISQVVDWQRLPLGVDNEVIPHDSFLLLLGFLVELVIADRRDLSRGTDACDLCSEVVYLCSRVRRISDDLLACTQMHILSNTLQHHHHRHHHRAYKLVRSK